MNNAEMKVILAALAMAAVVAAACGGGSKAKPTVTSTVEGTVMARATPTPEVRHTGIAEVDAVIDAILSGDANQLRPLVQFQPMPCAPLLETPFGRQIPVLCATGEPGGTVYEVLPVGGCQDGYVRDRDLSTAVQSWFTNPSLRLFAAYRSGRDVFIVFSRLVGQNKDRPDGLVATARDGRLIALQFGCGQTAEQFVASVSPQDFLLPP